MIATWAAQKRTKKEHEKKVKLVTSQIDAQVDDHTAAILQFMRQQRKSWMPVPGGNGYVVLHEKKSYPKIEASDCAKLLHDFMTERGAQCSETDRQAFQEFVQRELERNSTTSYVVQYSDKKPVKLFFQGAT